MCTVDLNRVQAFIVFSFSAFLPFTDCSLPEPERATSPVCWPWFTWSAALPSLLCSSLWVLLFFMSPPSYCRFSLRVCRHASKLPVSDPRYRLVPQCLSTLLMLCTSDMYTLINYVGFINYLFYGVTVAGQIVLRIKQPNMHRPIRVCIVFSLSLLCVSCLVLSI